MKCETWNLESRKTRKGMLLASEVLKMVLAVIAIGFLVYLLYSLYYSKVDGESKQKAAEILSELKNITKYIEETENVSSMVHPDVIVSGWGVYSYIDVAEKPNTCNNQNCFCLCDDAYWGQISNCDDVALCFIKENLMQFEEFDLGSSENPRSIEIFEEEGFIGVRGI